MRHCGQTLYPKDSFFCNPWALSNSDSTFFNSDSTFFNGKECTRRLFAEDPDFWAQLLDSMEVAYGEVLQQMPIFAMQSMIDTLNFYASHAPDLTAILHRIPEYYSGIQSPPGRCLSVQGGMPASGTPVLLEPCNSTVPQSWEYDRRNGQIRNPGLDKCLEVQNSNPIPRTPVWISDCNGTAAQKWTYDPISLILQNGLSTILNVREGSAETAQREPISCSPFLCGTVYNEYAWATDPPVVTLRVQALGTILTAPLGAPLNFTATIENLGPTGTFSVSVVSEHGFSITAPATVLIESLKTASITIVVNLPATAPGISDDLVTLAVSDVSDPTVSYSAAVRLDLLYLLF